MVVVPGSLPAGWCPPNDWQQVLNTFASLIRVYMPGQTVPLFVFGKDTPPAQYRAYPWIKLRSADVHDVERVYSWSNTYQKWICRHPYQWHVVNEGCPVVMLWYGTEEELKTFDGGDTGTLSDISGPMWEPYTVRSGGNPFVFDNAMFITRTRRKYYVGG